MDGMPVVLDSRIACSIFRRGLQLPQRTGSRRSDGIRIGRTGRINLSRPADHVAHEVAVADHTRGRDGMAAFSGKHKPVAFPSSGRPSNDVTALAKRDPTFTAALLPGPTRRGGASGHYAGGVVVYEARHRHRSQQELLQAIEHSPPVTRAH